MERISRYSARLHVLVTILLFTLVFALSVYVITPNVPQPYMDEIFHVPQAKRYCNFELLEWDPKITTLPGMYLVSAINRWTARVSCSIENLRLQNVVMYACCFFVLFRLVFSLESTMSDRDDVNDEGKESGVQRTREAGGGMMYALIKSLRIVLFPLLFSFSYLYYTDVGSTLFVIVSYLSFKSGNFEWSALFSTIAVLYRQTNIIWAFWIACLHLVNSLTLYLQSTASNKDQKSMLKRIVSFVRFNMWQVLLDLKWFAILGASFVLFVLINGGIVVGDRENHEVILHVTQIFYYSAFVVLMLPFHFIGYLKWVTNDRSRLLQVLLLVVVLSPIVAIIAHRFSHIHMFILSDNRHFIFYIWRRLFHIHVTPDIPLKYFALYSPVFVISMLFILNLLKSSHKSSLWILSYVLCTCLNLIPLPLIEFRYFLVPFILLNVSFKSSIAQEAATLVYYLLINAATLYLFIYRPFIGPDEEEARFMW